MKSKQFLKEGFVEDAHEAHMDHEVQMARVDCYYAAEHAMVLHKLLRNISEEQGLEGWVAAKITLANDYLKSVREHLEYQMMSSDAEEDDFLPLAESTKSNKKKINESLSNTELQKFERGPWYIIISGEVVPDNDGTPKKFNWLNAAKSHFRKMLNDDPKTAAQLKSEYDKASDKKSVIYYSKKLPTNNTPTQSDTTDEKVSETSNKPGLWANIRAKRERIKSGSGERMRVPGSKGAPSDKDLKSIRASSVKEGWQDEFADMVGQMKKSGRLGMPKSNRNFKTPEPKSKEELMSRLKELEAEFDPAYQQSDDYSFWKKQNDIASEISSIRRQLRQQDVAEGSLNEFASDDNGDDGYYKEYMRGYKDGKGYPEVVKSSKNREIWMTVTPKKPPLTEPYMRGWYDGKYGPSPGKDLINLDKLREQGVAEGSLKEVSKKMLGRYVSKARDDLSSAINHSYRDYEDDEADEKDNKRAEKRQSGIDLARAKMNKSGKSGKTTAKVKATEGVAEGLAPGQAAWKKEMMAKGAVSFKRDQHGGGAVDRIVAYDKDGKVVGGFNRKGVAEGLDPETTRLEQDVRNALENGDDYTAKQYAKMAPTPEAKKYLLNIIKQEMYGTDPEQGVAEGSEDLVQIEYWKQDSIEAGRWVKTQPMPRKVAEELLHSHPGAFSRGEIVDVKQGVEEGYQLDEMNPMLVRDGLQVVIDFLSQYPTATTLTAGVAGAAAGTAIIAKLVKNAWKNHKELEQLKQDVINWSSQKLHANKNVAAKGGKVAKIIQAEIARRKKDVAEGKYDLEEATSMKQQWKNDVKQVHGNNVRFEVEKAVRSNEETQSAAYDENGNKVAYFYHKSGRQHILPKPKVKEDLSKTDIKKQISKFEELALAANRAGDDEKSKQYQQKIQSLKQKMSQDVAEGSLKEDEYDKYETGKMGQEEAVTAMFTRLARQGIDPIDMIANRFGWSTYELDDLAQQQGFENTAEWLNSFEQGVAEGKSTYGDGKEMYVGIEAYGVRGMKSTPWRKKFKNQAAFEKWLDSTEGDVEVYGTREINLNDFPVKNPR